LKGGEEERESARCKRKEEKEERRATVILVSARRFSFWFIFHRFYLLCSTLPWFGLVWFAVSDKTLKISLNQKKSAREK